MPDARVLAEMVRPLLEERGYRVFEISAATHEGLRPLSFAMAEQVLVARKAAEPDETIRPVLTPEGRRRRRLHHHRSRTTASASAATAPSAGCGRPTSATTRPSGYLADRLARLGVEDRLIELGATPGSTVMIGGDDAVVFDWYPTILAGEAPHAGPRGTDVRLDARLDELPGGDR